MNAFPVPFDYFAASAISAAADWEHKSPTYKGAAYGEPRVSFQGIAERAYMMADAMLKAKEAKK